VLSLDWDERNCWDGAGWSSFCDQECHCYHYFCTVRSASAGLYSYQMYEQLEDQKDPLMLAASRTALRRRRQTVLRITPCEDEVWYQEHQKPVIYKFSLLYSLKIFSNDAGAREEGETLSEEDDSTRKKRSTRSEYFADQHECFGVG
jgi:hypothetical protein